MRWVSLLSPTARREILKVLLERRSLRELAGQLGVSPSAIVKYMRGWATPRDEVIARAIEIADDEEWKRIHEIISAELHEALREYHYYMCRRNSTDLVDRPYRFTAGFLVGCP